MARAGMEAQQPAQLGTLGLVHDFTTGKGIQVACIHDYVCEGGRRGEGRKSGKD